ncbi:MAG: MATE family efflux transporter [Oscillospiraceae bacterium]
MMHKLVTEDTSFRHLVGQVIRLSVPAILAEVTSVIMQYIDAGMVGSLGKEATAAIGLVSTSTWLIGGLCISGSVGFSVQVAQLIGAQREEEARNVLRQSLIVSTLFGGLLAMLAVAISGILPEWLGGEENIRASASAYFLIFALALPFEQMRMLSAQMLQCSGNMHTPSILNMLLCVLDVVFNLILIFPTRMVMIPLIHVPMELYGFGLGVQGAALGTALSEVCISILMTAFLLLRSERLALRLGGSWKLQRTCLTKAIQIALPTALEHTATCGAYVAATKIIAPLGNTAIAANSLAVTAESFCYMPGYGIGTAATTLIGQSIGAKRQDLAKRYAWITILSGMGIMSISAILMYFIAPWMFAILTNVAEVQTLGVQVLRMEAFAEPLYGASIVCSGVLRGAGDTLAPSIINLVSMWGVRITLSLILVSRMGLIGIWLAMCIELCCRGLMLLIRTARGKWLNKQILTT